MKNLKPVTQFQQQSGQSCFFIPPAFFSPVVILKQISGMEHLSIPVCVVDCSCILTNSYTEAQTTSNSYLQMGPSGR